LPVLGVAVLLAGCGRTAFTAPHATSAPAGVQHVGSFTVPAGQTLIVSIPTAIFATGHVEIDGTIAFSGAGSLAIFGPSVTVAGTIGTRPVGAAARRGRRPARGAKRIPADASAGAGPGLLIASDNLDLQAGAYVDAPGPCEIAALTDSGTITIAGELTAHSGADASASAPPGTAPGATPGGSVQIGTAQALADVIAVSTRAGTPVTPAEPNLVTVSGKIFGGNGGDGYDDVEGSVSGTTVTLSASDGAAGGIVAIVAETVNIAGGTLDGGFGGAGGSAGTDFVEVFATQVDGTGENAPGDDLVATVGGGGNGGNVSIVAEVLGAAAEELGGDGGDNGILTAARAGNGGPGGNGGSTNITLRAHGSNGTPAPPPPAFSTTISLNGGGSGGSSNTSSVPGGSGGAVAIGGPGTFGNVAIAFTNYANGGDGYGICRVTPPGPGTNGGKAMSLVDNFLPYGAKNSFNGGNGGDGNPTFGDGMPAGKDQTGKKIGLDGTSGVICVGIEPTPTPTPSPTPRATPVPSPTPSPTPGVPTPTPTPTPVGSIYGPLIVNPSSGKSSSGATQTFTVTQTGYAQQWGVSIGGNCSINPAVPSGPGPVNVVVSHTGPPVAAGNQDSCIIVFSGPTPTGNGGSVTATYTATFTQ
jgi:hypothetical protein